jgi:hypothetical protein
MQKYNISTDGHKSEQVRHHGKSLLKRFQAADNAAVMLLFRLSTPQGTSRQYMVHGMQYIVHGMACSTAPPTVQHHRD